MPYFQIVALLLNEYSALLLKTNATEVLVGQYIGGAVLHTHDSVSAVVLKDFQYSVDSCNKVFL